MGVGLPNGSKGSNGLRVLIALLGTLVALGPGFVSGCGGDDASVTPPSKPPPVSDATVPLVMVVTGGGIAPSADGSSSSGGITNPFGDLPEAGSSSGMSSSSGGSSDDGSMSDDDAAPIEAGPPPAFCPSDYVPIPCGVDAGDTCDLRSSVCCVTLSLQERCLVGRTTKCASNEASAHCTNACDCPNGQVCCGVVNQLVGIATSGCQTVADGGLCNPHPPTNTQASAQLCNVDAECKNGQPCIFQTCAFGAMFHFCGLQTGDPYDCTAN
jgi:hypothetical protein